MCPWVDEQGGLALTPVGFVILAHENLGRVAELARFLSLHGPVVIHVDTKASVAEVADLGPQIETISTRSCGWGTISLVDATLDAVRHLLDRHEVGHVCLLSGSCLPIRPIEHLVEFLAIKNAFSFFLWPQKMCQIWRHSGANGAILYRLMHKDQLVFMST